MSNKPIGIFDSGVGGLTVLNAIKKQLPQEKLLYFADQKYCPYGSLSKKEILELTVRCIEKLIEMDCKLIVIACNTATAVAIDTLRVRYSEIIFVGLEPAIKPAALASKKKKIGLLATQNTLIGGHYLRTAEKYKQLVEINAVAGNGLVELIEAGKTDSPELLQLLEKYLLEIDYTKIDYLVLGCTHYPLVMDSLRKICHSEVTIIDSSEAVAKHCYNLLSNNALLNKSNNILIDVYLTTGELQKLQNFLKMMLPISIDLQIVKTAI